MLFETRFDAFEIGEKGKGGKVLSRLGGDKNERDLGCVLMGRVGGFWVLFETMREWFCCLCGSSL